MKARLVKKEEEAKNIYTFHFKPDRKIHYVAGQFTELYLPHKPHDSRGQKHWFTLSSSPSDDLLTITTNFSKPGSTFKQQLQNLKKDDEVMLAMPMGDFVLPKDKSIPLVFVAGGIGCTPFHSIISWLNDQNESRDITLIYAANKLDKVAFQGTFKTLGDKFKTILNSPEKNWKGASGKLDSKKIKELSDYSDNHYIYLSGPEPMVEELQKQLKKDDFNKKRIYTDFFPGYSW